MTRIDNFVEKSGERYILNDFFLNLTLYDFNDLILNNLILVAKFIHCSLGAQRQKNDYNLAKGLRIKYGKGGYETQEKPRLSTGGRGVQA